MEDAAILGHAILGHQIMLGEDYEDDSSNPVSPDLDLSWGAFSTMQMQDPTLVNARKQVLVINGVSQEPDADKCWPHFTVNGDLLYRVTKVHEEVNSLAIQTNDMDTCLKCGDYEWPNKEKTVCFEKQIEFLSYTGDSLVLAFIVHSLVFFLMAAVILGIFISFRDTPVVKANNRNLSFILLVSIKLSFLSVFLFLGQPTDITCMLRQTSFGITFSIAMSSVLAKTILVCIAFKATKPDSPWRKWVGVKMAYYIVFFCSVIQILISVIWLATSSPFVEHNILSEPGKIIIECNEGSVIAFYIVLSYMGLLASVSFIVAFLARTLPDSFNEAKYITFSMLLFCSVWITMIPAYLSTKGKNMVAVEIFAIITSSCGLLFCIFLPKCYIVLLKPEINTKQYLLENNK
ncbi:vomeronasal type-2 receptor 26 [Xenopus laevis]|uniref:Vomeronasal type-2 receptor 26 n=1 Tax=Xenopus laevis TaxID=8355 RepID=A0A8J1LVW3_XENLA|nr:vomeronasal type-2 receptor 26 [Xenopus laevis]